MHQHQILGIRSYESKGQIKKTEKFFEKNWRADSIQDVLLNSKSYLAQVPEAERYNLFLTFAKCLEEKGRKLAEQWVIPFDIDDIDYQYIEKYAEVICTTLEINYTNTGFVGTGNGIHILVGIDKPILDDEFFERNRLYYKELCRKIEVALTEAKLPFKDVDTQIFKPGVMTRIPGTINKKPGRPDQEVILMNPFIVPIDFDLKERSGLSDLGPREALTKAQLKEHFKNTPADAETVLSDCPFMVYAQTSTTLSERQWYNALSIAVHLPSGQKVAHDISKHDPRYTERETSAKAEQAYTRSGPVKCSTICQEWSQCTLCPHYGKITSPITLKGDEFIASKDNGFRAVSEKGAGKIIYTDLVKFYKQLFTIITEQKSNTIFSFNGTNWVAQSDVEIEKFAYENIKPTPMSHECKEFRSQLSYGTTVDAEWFIDSTRGFMNFKNGVLDLGSWELKAHSPEFGFNGVIPFDYDKNAECPLWLHTMDKITMNRQSLKDTLQEFAGYILSGAEYTWHKALVLTGGGRNGKSTFMDTLAYCVGEGNYSSLPFRLVVQEKENLPMAHKLANFTEEVGTKEFLNVSATMKNLIGGGKYTIRDMYKKGYEIRNRTKFILACNELPKTNDTTKGFIERLIIVPFEGYFTRESDTSYDPQIKNKLFVEAPGIINWMIQGWLRLNKQNGFTNSEEVMDQALAYMNENDSVRLFANEHMSFKLEHSTQRSTVYQAYDKFCKENGLMTKGSPGFYSQLKLIFPKVVYARKRTSGNPNPVHCVLNLELDAALQPQF